MIQETSTLADPEGLRSEADAAVALAAEPQQYFLDHGERLAVELSPPNWQRQVTNLEAVALEPFRMRGTTQVYDSSSFARAVIDQAPLGSYLPIVYGDDPNKSVTAVLNQQQVSQDGAADERPGWGDHRVQLCLVETPEWTAWKAGQGLTGQEDFAEFIEEHLDEIDSPPAADMLDLAQQFQAHSTASFTTATRLVDGRINLNYSEENTATAGSRFVGIPETFTIVLRPFIGTSRVQIVCRLRYRTGRGSLSIGYQIVRPDLVEKTVFDQEVDVISEALTLPVLRGSTPPVQAARA